MKYVLGRSIRLLVTGFAMGIADLIPGVSGGTIAFLSGIYEELLQSIKEVSGRAPRLLLQGKVRAALSAVPFHFLVPLLLGIFAAIFSLANVLSWLLETYPSFVWAFFFGLVLASTLIVLKRVVRWDLSDKLAFVVSTVVTYFVVGMVPVETPTNLLFMFFSGMIAICAMILPGISGSFILLLLGKYQQILTAVTERDFLLLAVFATGCALGLALFARFLTWLFAHHHDISVAILAGIMLGSIRKIWPWKEFVSVPDTAVLVEKNILPAALDGPVMLSIALCLIGVWLVYYLDRKKLVKEQTGDIGNQEFVAEHDRALRREQ